MGAGAAAPGICISAKPRPSDRLTISPELATMLTMICMVRPSAAPKAIWISPAKIALMGSPGKGGRLGSQAAKAAA